MILTFFLSIGHSFVEFPSLWVCVLFPYDEIYIFLLFDQFLRNLFPFPKDGKQSTAQVESVGPIWRLSLQVVVRERLSPRLQFFCDTCC